MASITHIFEGGFTVDDIPKPVVAPTYSKPIKGADYNPVEEVLSRLDKVKPSSARRGSWMACCPAHDDKSPSLSVTEGRDGQVLLHCFGGCRAIDVVQALGLRLSDLFPYEPGYYQPPRKRRIAPLDALVAIDYEALIVTVIASDLAAGQELDSETKQRLILAASRIGAAREAYR